MPFASALSQHPVASEAVGEVAGSVLEALGERPELALLTVTRHHAGALEDIAATVEAALGPQALAGAATDAVIGTGQEVDGAPGVSLWAARTGATRAAGARAGATRAVGARAAGVRAVGARAVGITATPGHDGTWRFGGWPPAVDFDAATLILVCDPHTFPAADFLGEVERSLPGTAVVGGRPVGGLGPGAGRLHAGRRVLSAGAVGILLARDIAVDIVVSQGCRPFGEPFTVTASDGGVVTGLAGRRALDCLAEAAGRSLGAEKVGRLGDALRLGRLVDERIADPGPGDYLAQAVVAMDRPSGALVVDGDVPLGSTVRFSRRTARYARTELAELLDGRTAGGVLAFIGESRASGRVAHGPDGTVRWRRAPVAGDWEDSDRPDEGAGRRCRDAAAVARALGPLPTGGMVSAGEIAPVGGRNVVVRDSAVLALLRDEPA